MRLSLRWKIVGGYGLLLLLIALLGWLTLSLFTSLRSVQRRVFDDAIPGLVTVDEIVRSYTAQSAAVRGFLIDSQPALLDQYRREVQQTERLEDRVFDLATSPRERALIEDLVDAGRSFQVLVDDEVVPLASRGKRSLAFRLLSAEGTPLISEIESIGTSLRRAQDRVVVASESELRSRSRRVILTLGLVTVGALLVGIVLTIALPRRLVSNLSKLVEAARAIGRGDLNQRVEVRSGDEVEELALRFTEMQTGLQRLQQLALQDRELEIAGSIQKNLLQRTIPDIAGVRIVPMQRQANLVGGDWYDVDVSGKTLTVAVGDASGKGIAAALMATVALSVLRAERGLGAGPRRVIERADQALKDATDPDSFTTLVYATLDVRTGEIRWLNMGHPAPFLLRATHESGEAAGYFVEGPRNRALGWFDDPGLAETVLKLTPGDRLLLYTDGWIEAKAPEGEVFGENRLAQALLSLAPLRSEQLTEELVRIVERFAAGKLDDDLTMLIIEIVELDATQSAPAVTAEKSGEEGWHSRR